MNAIKYEYSVKTIPIPPNDLYLYKLIQKTEEFIKNLRWKAIFFLIFFFKTNESLDNTSEKQYYYNLKSNRCPPPVEELKEFENDLWRAVENTKFGYLRDSFQEKLTKDVKKIKNSDKIIIAADKTGNYYESPVPNYKQTVLNHVTKEYKKCDLNVPNNINKEAKTIATKLNVEKRINTLAEQQCFITIKDHKEDFRTNPKYRLINPAKSEVGKISKIILENINRKIRQVTKSNQWQSTKSAIKWFTEIDRKMECTFIIFDIADFYPSITKELLLKALNYARKFVTITEEDVNIIMHARKSLLYNDNQPWVKRNGDEEFDVTMGCHDGAETSELIGLFILSQLHEIIPKEEVGLYRDDGIGVLRNINGQRGEKIRKQIIEIFKRNKLKIEIKISKTADFLDVTFDLDQNSYRTYHKPNNDPLYVHKSSNHPKIILDQIPNSISRRISDNSVNKEVFDETAPYYNKILEKSGYKDKIQYLENDNQKGDNKRKRRREILWYKPPYSKNVKSKLGYQFINLIEKHFGNKENPLNKIFNKNKIKLSFSCMPNIDKIIKSHNSKLLNSNGTSGDKQCNCQRKNECPLNGECRRDNIVYSARVTVKEPNITTDNADRENTNLPRQHNTRNRLRPTIEDNATNPAPDTTNRTPGHTTPNHPPIKKDVTYIGAAENFKFRYANHLKSFRHEQYKKETELSKHIWELKANALEYSIDWKILKKTTGYNKITKSCNLCLTEKLEI